MKKYTIAHYRMHNTNCFVNGGKLIISEDEFIVRSFFKEVVRLKRGEIKLMKTSPVSFYRGIRLSNDQTSIELYFFPKTAEKLYSLFDIA